MSAINIMGELIIRTNPVLEDLTKGLPNTPPVWPEVIERYKNTAEYQSRSYADNTLPGSLGELYLRTYLTNWSLYTDLVVRNPFSFYSSTPHFSIYRSQERGNYVVKGVDGGIYTEYDEVAVVDNLPVLFDIKLRKRRSRGRPKNSGLAPNMNNLMRPEIMDFRIRPLQEYFGVEEFGYVLITPPETIDTSIQLQRDFIERGGLLIPFYTTLGDYRTQVETVKEKFNL